MSCFLAAILMIGLAKIFRLIIYFLFVSYISFDCCTLVLINKLQEPFLNLPLNYYCHHFNHKPPL